MPKTRPRCVVREEGRDLRESEDEDEGDGEGGPVKQAIGIARFTVDPAESDVSERPQAMTALGYELAISARTSEKGEDLGKTKLFFHERLPDEPKQLLADAAAAPDRTIVAVTRSRSVDDSLAYPHTGLPSAAA